MRHALARAVGNLGMTATDVAAWLGVDPKTVERWFGGRVPYPRYRAALAALTGWPARDLWPGATPPARPESALDEIRVAYPHRSSVPSDAWPRFFERAEHEIGVLAYSGLFLAEDVAIRRLLRDKARAGVRVRIALGDPDGEQVGLRGSDEGIDDLMVGRVRNALILYRRLASEPGIDLRLHDTVLYNSIYRADDDLLVNAHLYGCTASLAPVFHLHRDHDDGMAATYLDSFERVWKAARVLAGRH